MFLLAGFFSEIITINGHEYPRCRDSNLKFFCVHKTIDKIAPLSKIPEALAPNQSGVFVGDWVPRRKRWFLFTVLFLEVLR